MSSFAPNAVDGQEFRIDTDVYVGKSSRPVAHNVTIFSGPLIYDFQIAQSTTGVPSEMVIFDGRTRAFVLLDSKRKMRLELQQEQLLEIVEGARQQTMQSKDAAFLVNDNYVEKIDPTSGWVTFESPKIKYKFRGTQPTDLRIVPEYATFLNQFTRLAATDPYRPSPFPRLKLNESIKKLGWIPDEISVTLEPSKMNPRRITMSSKHSLVTQLSDVDRQRIESAKKAWMTYDSVSLAEYRGLPNKVASASSAAKPPATQTGATTNPVSVTEKPPTTRSADNRLVPISPAKYR